MPAEVPLSDWHRKILLHFTGRNKYAMLGHLKGRTGVKWEMLRSKQVDRPRSVVVRLRDVNRKYEEIRALITPLAAGRVKVQVGQQSSTGRTGLVVRHTLRVMPDAIPGAALFDWIDTDGLSIDMVSRYAPESNSQRARGRRLLMETVQRWRYTIRPRVRS